MDDEERIGPYNGHNKSEALPNGCMMLCFAILAFIAVFGAYGFIADWLKQ
jgi:nitrate reductase NapE component